MWLNGKTNFQLKSLSNLTEWHFKNHLGSNIDHGKDIGHTRYHTDVSEHQILAWNIKSSQIDLIFMTAMATVHAVSTETTFKLLGNIFLL